MIGKPLRFLLLLGAAIVSVPAYEAPYARVEERAREDGRLTIYSTADTQEVAPLLAAFSREYPFLKVDYVDITAGELYERFMRESNAGTPRADLLWSAGMDLQIKLVNDGYAQPYVSREKAALPDWAVWKNEAYGVTAEPIVFTYNKALMPAAAVPRSHADFAALLANAPDHYRGRIACYDPELSGTGFLYLTWDLHTNRDLWKFVETLGRARPTEHATSREMLDRVSDGRSLMTYNIIGSYALERQSRDPAVGVVMPEDYTLVMSRIAVIPRSAPHPDAAKLFLDFMLSRQGQSLLADRYMTPVRPDVPTPAGTRADSKAARAIRVGPMLLVYLDQLKRRRFLQEWNNSMTQAGTPSTGAGKAM
jgi:iron(III) transport system substrate-binding protein